MNSHNKPARRNSNNNLNQFNGIVFNEESNLGEISWNITPFADKSIQNIDDNVKHIETKHNNKLDNKMNMYEFMSSNDNSKENLKQNSKLNNIIKKNQLELNIESITKTKRSKRVNRLESLLISRPEDYEFIQRLQKRDPNELFDQSINATSTSFNPNLSYYEEGSPRAYLSKEEDIKRKYLDDYMKLNNHLIGDQKNKLNQLRYIDFVKYTKDSKQSNISKLFSTNAKTRNTTPQTGRSKSTRPDVINTISDIPKSQDDSKRTSYTPRRNFRIIDEISKSFDNYANSGDNRIFYETVSINQNKPDRMDNSNFNTVAASSNTNTFKHHSGPNSDIHLDKSTNDQINTFNRSIINESDELKHNISSDKLNDRDSSPSTNKDDSNLSFSSHSKKASQNISQGNSKLLNEVSFESLDKFNIYNNLHKSRESPIKTDKINNNSVNYKENNTSLSIIQQKETDNKKVNKFIIPTVPKKKEMLNLDQKLPIPKNINEKKTNSTSPILTSERLQTNTEDKINELIQKKEYKNRAEFKNIINQKQNNQLRNKEPNKNLNEKEKENEIIELDYQNNPMEIINFNQKSSLHDIDEIMEIERSSIIEEVEFEQDNRNEINEVVEYPSRQLFKKKEEERIKIEKEENKIKEEERRKQQEIEKLLDVDFDDQSQGGLKDMRASDQLLGNQSELNKTLFSDINLNKDQERVFSFKLPNLIRKNLSNRTDFSPEIMKNLEKKYNKMIYKSFQEMHKTPSKQKGIYTQPTENSSVNLSLK